MRENKAKGGGRKSILLVSFDSQLITGEFERSVHVLGEGDDVCAENSLKGDKCYEGEALEGKNVRKPVQLACMMMMITVGGTKDCGERYGLGPSVL